MNAPKPSFLENPSAPSLKLPPLSCDAHVHVFGPADRFPYWPDAPFIPADAPKEKLFAMHAKMGISRCVIVQSTCHGFDNRVVEDAIAAKGGDYLGVALAPTDVPDAELKRLDAAGFCGIRYNFMKHLGRGANPEEVIKLSERLAPLGWHLQIHFHSDYVHELAPILKRSAVPVVIDHQGRQDSSKGIDQPDFRALLDLMQDPRFHIKVSGSERNSKLPPPWPDSVPFAAKLVAEFGERCFWGTDWPHPNLDAIPDDGTLTDLLRQIAPGAALQAVLVDNPARFYRFAPR
jgi:2-pyrone-4,6-dicarboxylate lactonase